MPVCSPARAEPTNGSSLDTASDTDTLNERSRHAQSLLLFFIVLIVF